MSNRAQRRRSRTPAPQAVSGRRRANRTLLAVLVVFAIFALVALAAVGPGLVVSASPTPLP
jgi:type II secretory pathway component PulJ